MIRLNDLLNHAKQSGKRHEVQYPQTFDKLGLCEYTSNTLDFRVGIELEPNIWYWFYSFEYTPQTPNVELSFDHRYNQANGAIQKSIKKGWKAEKIILTK